MSSDTESRIPYPLVAVTVLVGSVSGLVSLLGTGLKIMKVAHWELFMQIGFLGVSLSLVVGCGMGIVWAVRVLRQRARGSAEGAKQDGAPE